MKFTLSWLKEYLDTNASLPEICSKLNNIGLEVESLEDQSKILSQFTVAQIIEALPHTNSTKLQICQVDVGAKENLQIICGAKNARSGLKVAYAPIDSLIPSGGMKIKKAKIAGVESNGMLCSAAELALGGDSEGIIEVDPKFAIGTKISEVFGLDDAVIEVNVTPNRGDCLSVFGVARDLAAAGVGMLKLPKIAEPKSSFASNIQVEIFSDDCQYFSGFFIKNIFNKPSPEFLKKKLEAIGCNSISAIVDIANYVMFSLGQPLHAYDADYLSGNLIVKNANAGEVFKSLKNQDHKLLGGELAIYNQNKIVALGGIVGGSETLVAETTQNIFLEAAFFNSENIAKTGRALNILSDARYRFERSVDLSNVKNALKMAANLILEICGGDISEVVEVGEKMLQRLEIEFDLGQIKKIIGIEIDQSFVIATLQNLGFKIDKLGEQFLKVQVPDHRSDIKIYQDLVEEVIRIYGLNQIASQALDIGSRTNQVPSALELLRSKLVNVAMIETINYSFVDHKLASLFDNFNPELQLQNPIAVQMDYMRPTLLVGLLQNVAKNQARGFNDLALFEIGRIFLGAKKEQQKNIVAGLRIGKNKQHNHYKDDRSFDVFDVKKDLFDCLEVLGFSASSFQLVDGVPNYYHQHRSKVVIQGKKIIGYFGELHPIIAKKFDIKGRVNIFEIFIEELPINLSVNFSKKTNKKSFVISDLLPLNRDFAFVLDKKVAVGDLLKKIADIDKSLISQVSLFDIYHDTKLGENKKSIAFSIQIQPFEKTLTGEEIEAISNKVITVVLENFDSELRK